MTARAYHALVALLAVLALAGGGLAWPGLVGFGAPESMPCEGWAAHPRPVERALLLDCAAGLNDDGQAVLVATPVELAWSDPDPALRALVVRADMLPSDPARRRYLRRHRAELARDVEGAIERRADGWVLLPAGASADPRRLLLGGGLGALAILLLVVVIGAQDRWTRRRERLLGTSRPTRF